MRTKIILFFVFLSINFLLFPKLYGQSSVYLKIKSDGFQPIELVVAPFTMVLPTDISEHIREIIINDLNLSGFFHVIDGNELNIPLTDWSSPEKQFQSGRTSALLEAQLEFRSALISFDVNLFDLPDKNMILKKQFQSNLKSIRGLAHEVADEVVFYLVGEKGIACTRIAFVSELKKSKELRLIDYDGYGLKQLTSNGSLNLTPSWSPNGKGIAFTSYQADNPDLMFLQIKDGRCVKGSTHRGLNIAPAWSPDGRKVAFTASKDGNAEIYYMLIKTRKQFRLTNHPAIDSSPYWSPGGREIVFTSDRSGTPQIYIMDAEGGSVRRLTYEGHYNDSPTWSPKGDRIAYVSREDGKFQIYTLDVNGENRAQVTDGSGNNENPSWAPDGFRIAYASNKAGKWDIYVINWDGTQPRQVTTSGGNVSPTWSPRLKLTGR